MLLRALDCGLRSGRLDEVDRWAGSIALQAEARHLVGLAHARAGAWDRALSWLRPLLDTTPPWPGLPETLSRLLAQQAAAEIAAGRYASAAQAAEEAVRLDGDNPVARQLLNSMQIWLIDREIGAGNLPDAIRLLERLLDLDPWNADLVHDLGVAAYRFACRSASSSPVRPPPRDVVDHWHTAIACLASSLCSPALRRRYLERLPSDSALTPDEFDEAGKSVRERVLAELRDLAGTARAARADAAARVYDDLEIRWGLEVEAARLVADLAPECPATDWPAGLAAGPLMLARWCRTADGRSKVARLRKSLARSTTKSAVRLQRLLSALGRYRYLIEEDRLQEAIAELRPLADWPPVKTVLGEALALRARACVEQRQFSAALALFEELRAAATLQGQGDLIAQAAIGAATEAMDEAADGTAGCTAAIGLLERAHALVAGHALVTQHLAAVYLRRGHRLAGEKNFTAAIADVRKALALDPADPETLRVSAVITWNAGLSWVEKFPAQAVASALESWALERDAAVIPTFSNALLEAHHFDHAIDLLRQLKQKGARGDAWNEWMANVYIERANEKTRRGDLSGALADAKEAYKVCPSHSAFRNWHP